MSRGDLTDAEWRILDPLLPDRGERGPAIVEKRRTVNGILWVLRTGAPWRDLPSRYGNWNSVFVRFTRWSKLGVWDAVFETVASLGPPGEAAQSHRAMRKPAQAIPPYCHTLRKNSQVIPLDAMHRSRKTLD